MLYLRCERGRPPQYQTVLSNITVTILPLLQKKRLPCESPFALCGTELQVNAPFRALVEAVERVDKANRAALITHDDGVGAGAAAEKMQSSPLPKSSIVDDFLMPFAVEDDDGQTDHTPFQPFAVKFIPSRVVTARILSVPFCLIVCRTIYRKLLCYRIVKEDFHATRSHHLQHGIQRLPKPRLNQRFL